MLVDGSMSLVKIMKANQDAPLILEPIKGVRFDDQIGDKRIKEATVDDSASCVHVFLSDSSEI